LRDWYDDDMLTTQNALLRQQNATQGRQLSREEREHRRNMLLGLGIGTVVVAIGASFLVAKYASGKSAAK
jgi:hypothetical protein